MTMWRLQEMTAPSLPLESAFTSEMMGLVGGIAFFLRAIWCRFCALVGIADHVSFTALRYADSYPFILFITLLHD
jgi:hypothetical protein